MNTVTFGELNSYTDLNLILNTKEIGQPSPKEMTINIEGADGKLDLTEFFGEVKYDNRKLKFEFSTIATALLDTFSAVSDALHGKKMVITLSDDPSYYYVGRISVFAFKNERGIGKISVEADCEPYKYKNTETSVVQNVMTSKIITLTNSRLSVVPTITTTAEMAFVWGGNSVTHSAGTFIIPTLILKEGQTAVTVTGSGSVTFTYQEGRL